jgi:hypothetical protein
VIVDERRERGRHREHYRGERSERPAARAATREHSACLGWVPDDRARRLCIRRRRPGSTCRSCVGRAARPTLSSGPESARAGASPRVGRRSRADRAAFALDLRRASGMVVPRRCRGRRVASLWEGTDGAGVVAPNNGAPWMIVGDSGSPIWLCAGLLARGAASGSRERFVQSGCGARRAPASRWWSHRARPQAARDGRACAQAHPDDHGGNRP